MALIQNEKVLTTLDDTPSISISDYAKALQDFLQAVTYSPYSTINITPVTSIESKKITVGGYGVRVAVSGIGASYIINLSRLSPLEATKQVLCELPKAFDAIEVADGCEPLNYREERKQA